MQVVQVLTDLQNLQDRMTCRTFFNLLKIVKR